MLICFFSLFASRIAGILAFFTGRPPLLLCRRAIHRHLVADARATALGANPGWGVKALIAHPAGHAVAYLVDGALKPTAQYENPRAGNPPRVPIPIARNVGISSRKPTDPTRELRAQVEKSPRVQIYPQMPQSLPSYYHVHLVSDATGETLTAISKAVGAQYQSLKPIEHLHLLVRTPRQLKRVLQEIEQAPGIVLHTIVNKDLVDALETRCRELKVPAYPVLQPVLKVFEAYLGAPQTPTVAGQHVLDAEYFKRIDAMNFTLQHDDGRLPEDLNQADIVLLGISRTSKTPTSIYLAQRGYKTTNLPLVPSIPLPAHLTEPHNAFVVCLVASVERITEVRRNRAMLMSDRDLTTYADRTQIAEEIAYSRRVCAEHGWPMIDVTRKSIEETAATIIQMMNELKLGRTALASDASSIA